MGRKGPRKQRLTAEGSIQFNTSNPQVNVAGLCRKCLFYKAGARGGGQKHQKAEQETLSAAKLYSNTMFRRRQQLVVEG